MPDPIDAVLDREPQRARTSRWVLAATALGVLMALPFLRTFMQAVQVDEGTAVDLVGAAVSASVLVVIAGLLVGLWANSRLCAWLLALGMVLDCLYQLVGALMGAQADSAMLQAMGSVVFLVALVLILIVKATVFVMAALAIDRRRRTIDG